MAIRVLKSRGKEKDYLSEESSLLYKESASLIKLLLSFAGLFVLEPAGLALKSYSLKWTCNHECQFCRRSLKIYTERVCVIFSGMMSWKDPQFKQTFSCNDKSMGFNDNWVNVMNDALY